MDGATMLYNWRLGFDVLASGAAPGFTDTQVYSLLNRAQDYIIDNAIDNKEVLDIKPLILDAQIAAIAQGTKLWYIGVPIDYWKYYESHSDVIRTAISNTGFIPPHDNSSVYLMNELITPEEAINYHFSTFNNIRVFKAPKAYMIGTNLYVIGDDYTTISYIFMRYIRKRVDISGSVSCELPEIIHRKVVDKAIDIAKVIINIQEPQSSKE